MLHQTEILIRDITEFGEGVGRLSDGKVVFVEDALPGELVNIRLTTQRSKFAKAEVIERLDTSPHRQTPPCPHFGQCGGCLLQHLQYPATLPVKEGWIRSTFHKIAGTNVDTVEMIGMDTPNAYRNKATFHGGVVNGRYHLSFYQKGSHGLFLQEECLILPSRFLSLKSQLASLCEQLALYPTTVMMRMSGGLIQLKASFAPTLSRQKQAFFYEAVAKSFSEELCLPTQPNGGALPISLGDKSYLVGGQSFFQVNTTGAERLYELLRRLVAPLAPTVLYDLYCGVGSIGISLANLAPEVVGIEIVPEAVRLARENARRNRVENLSVLQGAVETTLSAISEPQSCVLVDPPRGGLAPAVLEHLLTLKPAYILYIGCGLGAMARDIKRLGSSYQLMDSRLYGVDLFPYSGHVETCALMVRVNK